MAGLEDSYIRNIDKTDTTPPIDDIGMRAEDLVIDFFNENFPGQFTVRHATPEEDSGVKQIEQGKQIDAVVYDEKGAPVMCIQISTARNKEVRREKVMQLMSRPFIRLTEMRAQDPAIPKVLVNIDPIEASTVLIDHDFSKHPKISEQIIRSSIESLGFVLTKTQLKDEQDRVRTLISILEKGKGGTH